MSETRASLRKFTGTQKESFSRSARQGRGQIRQLSSRIKFADLVDVIRGYINEVGKFIDSRGQMISFDFLGSPGRFLYQNRNHPVTLASGVVQALNSTGSHGIYVLTVDTESAASTDDLDTITLFPQKEGNIVVLKAADSARTVVVKNGTGNITCGSDFSLTHVADTMTLMQIDDGSFIELSRSDNAT